MFVIVLNNKNNKFTMQSQNNLQFTIYKKNLASSEIALFQVFNMSKKFYNDPLHRNFDSSCFIKFCKTVTAIDNWSKSSRISALLK